MPICESCCIPKRDATIMHYDFATNPDKTPNQYILNVCQECRTKDKAFNFLNKFIDGGIK